MRLNEAKKIMDTIRKHGGYLEGSGIRIYYPPEEPPLSKEEIEECMKKFRECDLTKTD